MQQKLACVRAPTDLFQQKHRKMRERTCDHSNDTTQAYTHRVAYSHSTVAAAIATADLSTSPVPPLCRCLHPQFRSPANSKNGSHSDIEISVPECSCECRHYVTTFPFHFSFVPVACAAACVHKVSLTFFFLCVAASESSLLPARSIYLYFNDAERKEEQCRTSAADRSHQSAANSAEGTLAQKID